MSSGGFAVRRRLLSGSIAVLASYVRSAWGNAAPSVSTLDVLEAR